MKMGLRIAGVGAALLAGAVSTGTTVFAASMPAGSSAVTAAVWDRGGDHHDGDRDHHDGDHGGDWRHGDGDHGRYCDGRYYDYDWCY
jgi:hypothetical protein